MTQDDGRRRAGAQTRHRLLEATAEALARSGPRAVSMRAITTQAEANVAAVKYHFGSRESLIEAVLTEATRHVAADQDARLSALEARSDEVGVREWLEAWAAPLVGVVTSTSPTERRLGRILGNALVEQSELGPTLRTVGSPANDRLLRGLSRALAPVDERELDLRRIVMVSALSGLAGGLFDDQLARVATDAPLDRRLLDVLEAIVRTPTSGFVDGG